MNIDALRDATLAVALGISFLHVFFRAVRTDWPGSYFGPTDVTAYAITASPVRYALYRLSPLFVVGLFVAVTLERRDGYAVGTVLVLSAMHALMTNGLALGRWAFSGSLRRHRLPITLVRAIVFVLLLGTGLAAYLTRNLLESVVPPLEDLVSALWTAVLAGVLGVYITRVSAHGGDSSDELTERSFRQIDPSLKRLMRDQSAKHGTDPTLGLAVMAVENLQRPAWFRRIERIKSFVQPAGTYGIMQVSADHWIDDEESVRQAVQTYLRGVHVPADYAERHQTLEDFARKYNPDPVYIDLLQSAVFSIEDQA